MTAIQTVTATAVVGVGYMGGGIAQVLALHGYKVALGDVDAGTAERARIRLVEQARKFESQALLPEGAAELIRGNLSAADSIEDAVAAADYITEAVPEEPEIKASILRRISSAAQAGAVIGTNTSAIPIKSLALSVAHPERFLGVHWMNPAPFIPGVEIIPGPDTDAGVLHLTEALIHHLGKIPSRVADTPGFVANRLQFALYKESLKLVEDGVATVAEIDAVVSNTFGFRLALFGPFAIGDMAGLDVYAASFRTLETAYGERFAAPGSLLAAVKVGNLGLKNGQGFRDIDPLDHSALLAYRDNAYARLSQLRVELGDPPGLRRGSDE